MQHKASPARPSLVCRRQWVAASVCWFLLLCSLAPLHADRLGRAVELNQAGEKDEAIRLLESILIEEPANHRALWNRGLLSMEQASFKEAAHWFDRAIAVDDGVAIYHLWRGYAQAKRVDQASWVRKPFLAPPIRAAFERAVELDESSVEARRALMRYYERAPAMLGGSKRRASEQANAIEALEAEASGE